MKISVSTESTFFTKVGYVIHVWFGRVLGGLVGLLNSPRFTCYSEIESLHDY